MKLISQVLALGFLASCGVLNEPSRSKPFENSTSAKISGVSFGSGVDSVEIPQTPVEDQFQIGFCWAYAMNGLIESDYKLRTGKSLQLSEEALGFYRMVEGIYDLMQHQSGLDLNYALATDSFQGWVLKSNEVPDSFALVKKYGVVPESAWTKKFKSDAETEKMVETVRKAAAQLLSVNFDPKSITREEIVQKILLAPGAWSSAPPTNFVVDGKAQTPMSYFQSLDFNPDKFSSVLVNNPSDLDALIAATKRALVRGVSVPLGFPVNMDLLKGDTFSGAGQDLKDHELFFKDGGHAVLIDDFVNSNSSEGALPVSQVLTEFLRPTKDLNYFVFKNSWGKDSKSSANDYGAGFSSSGYYKIDQDYLKGSANLTKLKNFKGILEVVVPNDIALDPFGKETVNPKVAAE
jgi:hypothetical protein